MALLKRAGSPYFWIEFEAHGERVRQSAKTANRRTAEEVERRLRTEAHDRHVLGKVDDCTLHEAAVKYFDTVIKPKGNKDVQKREAYALKAIEAALGADTPLSRLTAKVISDYGDSLIARGLALATVNRHLATIRAILRKAHRKWRCLAVVPVIELHRLDNSRTRWLTAEEEVRLLAVSPPHLYDLLVFLLDTGARLGEAAGLTWAHVDLAAGERGRVRFMDTKTNEPRSVPLTKRASAMLHRLKARKDALLYAEEKDREAVFLYLALGRGGGGKNRGKGSGGIEEEKTSRARAFRNPHGAWATAREKSGLLDVHIHDLRHTYASRLAMKGVTLLTLKTLLGHKSIRMTERYSHLSPDVGEAAVALLDQPEAEALAIRSAQSIAAAPAL